MSPNYALLVRSVEGIRWTSGSMHRSKPNLYAVIHRDGVELQRTPTIERVLDPTWDHLFKLSPDPLSSEISFRVFHHSSVPWKQDKCVGVADIPLATLTELCGTDGKVVKLPLTGRVGDPKERSAGTISVRLVKDTQAAVLAINLSQKGVEELQSGILTAAMMGTGSVIVQSVSTAEQFYSGVASLTSKLEILVRIGDEIATIHPYVNAAWKVLTSVYQSVRKQQETDKKLVKLVETLVDVYSFVSDAESLSNKIRSLEDKVFAIVKQTVECAFFIQEYTTHGFYYRAVSSPWTNVEQRMDAMLETLLKLKESFDGGLTIQSLFISTKVLENVQALEQSDTLKMLKPVDMNAASRVSCLQGTQQEILDKIIGWLAVPSDSGNFLWLSGVAGCGKSTISTTVSEFFRELHRLGAFLFFDRNDRLRSHPDAVIRTLAHMLAQFDPQIGSAIASVIHRDPAIVNAPIHTQFKELVLVPLQSAERCIQGPILIILDALDECGDHDSRSSLLSLISTEFPKLPSLFRILITSRRDADIHDKFKDRFAEDTLNVGQSSTRDVDVYLRHELSRIEQNNNLGSSWPGQDWIHKLVYLAGGLFIWAATAVRFIDGYRPDKRLKLLAAQNSSLDHLYSVALRDSGPWDADTTFSTDAKAILAWVVLGRVPMADTTINVLLGSADQSSADVLKYLACVVQWSPGQEARILHASFADYLTDPKRSGQEPWFIDTSTGHEPLSLGCLRVLRQELRFNICGLEDSHGTNADVADLAERVSKLVSPQLSYSSRFWFHHIKVSPFHLILDHLEGFLHHQFLYWLEILSVVGEIPLAAKGLRVSAEYTKSHHAGLEAFVDDAIKFIQAFAPVLATSAPHIYLSALPFSPRTSQIAKQFAKFFPGTLKFQSTSDNGWLNSHKVFHGHRNTVASVDFSPNGKQIVSGSYDTTIRIWDTQTTGLIHKLPKNEWSWVTSVQFSPDASRVACGSKSGSLHIWDVETGSLVRELLKVHDARVCSICFSPNGSLLASGSSDKALCVWDVQTGLLVAGPFKGHTAAVKSGHFSPDGVHLASGSADHTICVWDVETGTLVLGPLRHHTDSVSSVHFSPNGAQIVSGSYDRTVCVWDARTGNLLAGPFHGHLDQINSVRFSPDGVWIASASHDRTVRVWDAQTGSTVAEPFDGHTSNVSSVCFSPDSAWLGSGSYDFTIRLWDVKSVVQVRTPFPGHTHEIRSLAFAPNGTRIASGSDDRTVRVWDVKTGEQVGEPLEGHRRAITSVQFSPDGLCIASGSKDGTLRVWHSQTGTLFAGPFEGHLEEIFSIHFSPDSEKIVSGSVDKTLRVWHALTGKLISGPFRGHSLAVISVRFCPNGTLIASGSLDSTVRICDAHTGVCTVEPLKIDGVASICFSPDGRKIASGSFDGTIQIWDVETGTLVAGPFGRRGSPILTIEFSPHNIWIASGGSDMNHAVRVWDANTGTPLLGPFVGHADNVTSVKFSPDGIHIASASSDNTVRIFEINSSVVNPLGDYTVANGWVVNAEGGLLFWVPPWLREGLYLARTTLVICRKGTTKLDLSHFVHGTQWQKCREEWDED